MNDVATGLATLATTGAALVVLLVYSPWLPAPFLVPKFAALEIGGCLGFVALALRRLTPGPRRWRPSMTLASWLVLGTTAIAWAAAAGRPFGAPYATASMARWGALFGLACGASALDDSPGAVESPHAGESQVRMLGAITAAAVAVAAIGLLQHGGIWPLGIPVISMPGSTFGNRNASGEVMAMALPLGLGALMLTRHRPARTVLVMAVVLELVYLAVTRTRGAWIASVCGMGTTLALARVRWSWSTLAGAVAVALTAAVAAAIPGRFNPRDAGDSKRYAGVVEVLERGVDSSSPALKIRFGLWRRTLHMVREHPLLGVGPGNWPIEFPRYAEPDASRDGVLTPTLAPRQAHDDILERTAETGFVGLAALGGIVFAAASAVRARLGCGDTARRLAAAAAGALVSFIVLGVASFPLDESGPRVLAGLSLGLVAAEPQEASTSRRAPRRVAAIVATGLGVLLTLCAVFRAQRNVRSSYWLGKAERDLWLHPDSSGDADALIALKHALTISPDSYRAHMRKAEITLREGKTAESAIAARHAIALEPYSPNGWASLAAAELAGGDPRAAQHAATTALELLHDHPPALSVRARAASQLGEALAAQADEQHLRSLATGSSDTAQTAQKLLRLIN